MKSCRRDIRAQGTNAASSFVIGDVFDLLRKCEIRIPFQVMRLHHDLLNVITIGTNEPPTEAIEGLAELGCSGGLVKFVCTGTKATIDPIEKNDWLLGMRRRRNLRRGQS